MKTVKIERIRLENFKGIRSLELDFGDMTEIRGRNATGKTTIVDAFTWCLFGKDSMGRSAFNIKTIGDEGVIPKIDHSVEVVLVIDSDGKIEKKTLKRVLKEDWVKPRGKAELVMQGNTTQYLIDGLEVKASQYSTAVGSVIDEQMFRMVTSPSYFPTMDWKQQREILIRMSGEVSYADVAFDSDLKKVLAQLDGSDMATFKAKLANQKRPIREELEECPTRVSAIESVTPEPVDFAKIEAEVKALEGEYESNLTLMQDRAFAYNQQFEAIKAKQKHINELRLKQMDIVSEAERAEQQRVVKANAEYSEKKMKLESLERGYELFKQQSDNELKSIDADIAANKERIASLTKECDELRTKWGDVNGTVYTGSEAYTICPLLNVACSDQRIVSNAKEKYGAALKAFNEKKAAELAEITETGKAKMSEKSRVEQYVMELSEKRATRSVEIADEEKKRFDDITLLKSEVAFYTVEQPKPINPQDISEWVMLEESIKSEESAIQEPQKDNDTALEERNAELQSKIKALSVELAKRDTINTNKGKIAEIQAREKELAQQLADLEGQEYNAERLEKAYVTEVESRVNKMFGLVKFRMFEKQINGGEYPTCVAMVDNVPYGDLNNAMKINSGIDITNTLSKYFGISAPLFIDNSESLNEIRNCDSQLIKLVVSNDKNLVVSHD